MVEILDSCFFMQFDPLVEDDLWQKNGSRGIGINPSKWGVKVLPSGVNFEKLSNFGDLW